MRYHFITVESSLAEEFAEECKNKHSECEPDTKRNCIND